MKGLVWLGVGLIVGVVAFFIYQHYQTIKTLYKNRDTISTATNTLADAKNLWSDVTALWTEFKGR